MKNRRKQTLLDKDTLSNMAKLLNSGFSLQECMEITEEPANRDVYQKMNESLSEGEVLSEVFVRFVSPQVKGYLWPFLQFVPFQSALSISLSLIEVEDSYRKEMVRNMLYPVLLMAGMIMGVLLFSRFVLPQMLNLMKDFSLSADQYEFYRILIQIISVSVFLIIVLGILAGMYFLNRKHIAATYSFLARHNPGSILIRHSSRKFVCFYLECERKNIPTIQALHILQTLPSQPIVSLIAYELDKSLKAGQSLTDALSSHYVDPSLKKFMKIALYASDSVRMLEGYLEMVNERTRQLIRRFTRVIQLVSYAFIGSVMIFVYQVLMMPMLMLQSI